MLFAIAAFLRAGTEDRVIDYHDAFNEHLGPDASNVRIAGVLHDEQGCRSGYLALFEGSRQEAQAWLDDSPHLRAGLYYHVALFEYRIEVGTLG